MLGGKIGLPELLILLAVVFSLWRSATDGRGIGEGIKNFKAHEARRRK
jgi:hypothetical protein